jgi:hypothetical protein
VEECKQVIDTKMQDKFFIDHPKYLNPVTLFRPSHFDNYVNEADTKPKTESDEWIDQFNEMFAGAKRG